MKFRKDYGVFCCEHVFKKEREIRLIVRDEGYQFLCGNDDIEGSEPRLVGIQHILSYQPEIENIAVNLSENTLAYKDENSNIWNVESLENE